MDSEFNALSAVATGAGCDSPRTVDQRLLNSVVLNPNGMQHWFPAVKKTDGLLYPETRFIDLPIDLQLRLMDVLEGGKEMTDELMADLDVPATKIADAVADFGGTAFLRTGITSLKHQWQESCFIADGELSTARRHMGIMIQEGSFGFAPPSNILVVRKMIPATPVFTAFGGMPVTREFRFFADGTGVLGHQFYWPDTAFESHANDLPATWREDLQAIACLSEGDYLHLSNQARAVASHLSGPWSIDFLQGKDGKWYLIDMAKMEHSYIASNASWTHYGKKKAQKA